MNAIPPFAHLCEPAASLEDGHGRTVRYIRLSVTDRCNLRCTYCRSGMETFIPHESVLRYEEMEQLVDMAMDMGVEKVRLTGGEPFARKGFADFLERLRAAHPALDIRVTTNGTLIGPHIQTLKAIGLNAVNLSLDTFDRDKFEQITGRDLFGKVRENMDALLDAEAHPGGLFSCRLQRRRAARLYRLRHAPPHRRAVHRIHADGRRHALVGQLFLVGPGYP